MDLLRSLLLCALAALLAAPALASDGDAKAREKAYEEAYEQAIEAAAKKDIFGPYKPPPPKPKPRKKPAKKKPEPPKVVRDVREDLVVTGFLWDNAEGGFIALVETRDGQKRLSLHHGDTVGDYTVKVVLDAKLVLTGKDGKPTEVELGGAFKGGVIGKETVTGVASSSSSSSSSKPKGKPLPKLSSDKKMSIIERLKARRAAQLKKKQEAKGKK